MDQASKQSARSKHNCLPVPTPVLDKSQSELDSPQWMYYKKGFPPGMTVDELKQYRRKCPPNLNGPIDNLHVEGGSLKAIKTEYNRRFQAPTLEELNSCRSVRPKITKDWQMTDLAKSETSQGEYKDKYLAFPRERPRNHRPHSQLHTESNVPMEFMSENLEKYIAFPNAERSKSLRRATALKPEGEFQTETESRSEFHSHGNLERVQAVKRPVNLKLEGLFESLTTEQKGKYIDYLVSRRPAYLRRNSELKLDGAFDFETESKAKYVDPGSQPRSVLRKRSTSLKLDGETNFIPEYSRSFVDYPRVRPSNMRPHGQLYSEGELDLGTESRSQFIRFPLSQVPMSAKAENNIRLEGTQNLIPEYQEQFKTHGRSKSEIIRRRDNLNLEGGFTYETENGKYKYTPSFPKESSPALAQDKKSSLEPQAPKMYFSDTEYHSQFLDFPRQRPTVRKPSSHFDSSGPSEMTTEKRSQYRSYGTVPRTTATRQRPCLLPEGGFEGEAEYKNKFIEFPYSYNKVPKPTDSLSNDYPSFHVLDNKPQDFTPFPLEPLHPSSSPSSDRQPSYRLEVHNVDGEPRGFHRSPERVFAPKAAVSHTFASTDSHQAAVEAALKRRLSYERNSPDVGKGRSGSGPSKKHINENGNKPAFTVLDNRPDSFANDSGPLWSPPVWNDTGNLPPSIVT